MLVAIWAIGVDICIPTNVLNGLVQFGRGI